MGSCRRVNLCDILGNAEKIVQLAFFSFVLWIVIKFGAVFDFTRIIEKKLSQEICKCIHTCIPTYVL